MLASLLFKKMHKKRFRCIALESDFFGFPESMQMSFPGLCENLHWNLFFCIFLKRREAIENDDKEEQLCGD